MTRYESIIDRFAHGLDDRRPDHVDRRRITAHDRHAPGLPPRRRDRHPAAGLARRRGDGRRATRALLPAARRAGRGRRLRHVALHGAGATRRCARAPASASPTPGRRPSTGSTAATTGCWRSPAPAPRPRCVDLLRGRAAAPVPATVDHRRRPALRCSTSPTPILTAAGRRAVRGADPVRDHHPGDAALAPRRGPDRGGRAGPGRCSTPTRARSAPAVDRRADHLRRPRLDQRHRPGGGAQAAGVGPAVDRVLPDDGVPPRPDQHQRARPGRLGLRRPGRRASPTTSRVTGADLDARADRRRWPTCCGCTGSASCGPAPPGSTPTSRATSPGRSSSPPDALAGSTS